MRPLREWWRSTERPTIGSVLFVFLLLSMTVLSVLSGWAFHRLNETRARTADDAIREYASLGARLFGDRAFGLFEGSRLRILGSIYATRMRPGEPLPDFGRFVADAGAEMDAIEFAVGDTNRGFFRLDARTGEWRGAGAVQRPEVDAQIRTTVQAAPRPRLRRLEPMAWRVSDLPNEMSMGMTALRGVDGTILAWYGFTYTRTAGWRAVGDAVMRDLPLLPAAFLEPSMEYGVAPTRTDSLVAIRILDQGGALLYQSRPPYPGITGGFDFNSGISALRAEATLHPTLMAELRRSLRAGAPRVYLDLAGARRVPLPLDVMLPLVAALLALLAGVGVWRERALQRARRDFVASVSHELRTPLAQIRMFTETLLLRRERDEDERTRWLGIVSRESRRLGDLVENILLFSHIDADRVRIEKERTDLGELIEEVVEGYVPVATEKGMRLVADAPSRIFVMADPRAMRQVVVNLLDNALKYGPRGQLVTIELERVGDRAEVTVTDQGEGIPAGERQRIWEPFVRLGDRGTTGGSGIGLSVVRDLVLQHDGTIAVGDAPGGGARFVVTLPVRESAEGLPPRATGEFRAREVAATRAAPELRPD